MKLGEKLRRFKNDAKRVLIVSKKPTKDEFVQASKITGLGIIAIGLIGFIIFLAFHYLIG